MGIKLSSILPLSKPPSEYKLHLACWNGTDEPLDVFVQSWEQWKGWNEWRGDRDDFSRDFILALINFYPEPDTWLFGGVFKVLQRSRDGYKVSLDEDSREFVGRLKVLLRRPGRAKAVYLENYYDQIVVSEILKEVYTGQVFCGYENINHDFRVLESIFRNSKPDWKAALENIKGVYLITDKSNGRRYVGSAYGEMGIWARWACYIDTGHGWNNELSKLIKKQGIEYARKNLQFVLLEYRSMKTDDRVLIEREQYWKEALLSRAPFGYNKN